MWPYPQMIAHRGAGLLAPENTLAALRAGIAAGYRGVEFDVMLAADGVPVLVHDEALGRTVAGRGRIPDYPARALARMDAGSWLGPQWASEGVPSYREAFDLCAAAGVFMNVEIKPSAGADEQTGTAVAQLTAQWMRERPGTRVLFSSFSRPALQAAMKAAPGVPRGLLLGRAAPDWREQMQAVQAQQLHIDHRVLNPELAREVHAAGYGLFCYTVNTMPRARKLARWGVDAVCTDRIDLLPPGLLAA